MKKNRKIKRDTKVKAHKKLLEFFSNFERLTA
jgi:hypothetical protein